MKLAYLVEKAKKNKLPSGSIKAILERYQTQKISDKNLWIYVQGPDGCLLIFQLVTNNLHVSKARVNHHIKKCMYVCHSSQVFQNSLNFLKYSKSYLKNCFALK